MGVERINLCGEFVTHKVFGRGKIIKCENNSIIVLFNESSEGKKFVYPSALGSFLELENKLIVKQFQEYKDGIAQNKAIAQKEAEDEQIKEKLAIKERVKILKKTMKKKKVNK